GARLARPSQRVSLDQKLPCSASFTSRLISCGAPEGGNGFFLDQSIPCSSPRARKVLARRTALALEARRGSVTTRRPEGSWVIVMPFVGSPSTANPPPSHPTAVSNTSPPHFVLFATRRGRRCFASRRGAGGGLRRRGWG